MKKSLEVKEKIIQATIALIEESSGNAAEITTRDIAEKANVGNGLINYHFQTKENLIILCVQRIIGRVVENFHPSSAENESTKERLCHAAGQVFEFFFLNPAIARLSMLGDFTAPDEDSNTAKSVRGIQYLLGDGLKDEDKKLLSFVLASVMQTAFLANRLGDTLFGCPLDTPAARKAFISKLVNILFEGVEEEK